MFAEYNDGHEQKFAGEMHNEKKLEGKYHASIFNRQRKLCVRLDNIGHGLIVSLPIALAVANRSSSLFLTFAALCVLASRLASGAISFNRSALEGMRTGALILVLCGIAYPLISLGWALRPTLGLFSWGEAMLPVVSGAILVSSWRVAPPPRWMVGALAWSMLVAGGLISTELLLDFPLQWIFPDRVGAFIQNRPVVTLSLLLAPVIVLLGFRRRPALCSILLLATTATIAISDSEAAKLGLLAAAGTFALSYAPFVWVRRLLAIALLGLIWMQPFFGSIVARSVPDTVVEATKGGHSRERIELWQAFSDVARRYPIFGTGFASSPHMGDHPVAAEIDPAYRPMLKVGHPHNAFLQVWVELGAIGALLLSCLVLWVLRCLGRAPADIQRVGLMTLISASAIALVSHGAWQGWWMSAIALSTALLTLRPIRTASGRPVGEEGRLE
ncbi:O-antigen ligase family protein [Microvirga calopogonii]|uniref:O-antigen ligase family protein n=1 Tax=Microvirga calopogonii TaxID=2078013 RepID=UPI0013B388F9|nr:O-antigen ligase family protein [Microvirga calopogonii]